MHTNSLQRIAVITLLFATFAAGAAPRLLKDVNTRPLARDSLCGAPVAVNGAAYFCGADHELWKTDGTSDGTRPVRDADGHIVRNPGRLAASGGLIYVVAGGELWRSNGTRAGTFVLRDDDERNIAPEVMSDVGGTLFFFHGSELWKTNGAQAGTRQVYAFSGRPAVNDATALNGELIFTNYDHEVWASDGTAAGTRMLRDLEGQNLRDDDNNLTRVGDVVFFSLEAPGDTRDLWKTDGTMAGTQRVREAVAGRFFSVEHFFDVAGTLFFIAESNYTDTVIWRSDGTTGGTVPVATLANIPYYTFVNAAALDGVYLLVNSQAGLWRSDGSPGGTFRLTADVGISGQSPITVYDGLAYFSAENGSGLGEELWVSNGRIGGTRLLRDIHWQQYPARPGYFATIDGGVIFQANRGRKFGGPSLWTSDGTVAGTRQVRDLSHFTYGAYPSEAVVAGKSIYFLADSVGNPSWRPSWSLWQSDGSREGTRLLLDPSPGQVEPQQGYGDEFAGFAAFGGDLYVSARDPSGWGLWRTVNGEGIEAATWRLPVPPVRSITGLTQYNTALFFFSDTDTGRGLWRLESGSGPAILVQDGLVDPRDVTVAQNRLVFTSRGDELWWSDGSRAGTRRIASLGLGPDTRISNVQTFNEGIAFQARWEFNRWGNTGKTALWLSDGTALGTRKIRRPYPAGVTILNRGLFYSSANRLWLHHGMSDGLGVPFAEVDSASRFTKLGRLVYFLAGSDGSSLWVTDGTADGTRELIPGAGILSLGVLDGAPYFTAWPSDGGTPALWRFDAARSLAEIVQPGLEFFEPLDAVGNRFTAFGDGLPQQVWQTDGTAAGTRPITDFESVARVDLRFTGGADFLVGDTHLLIVDDGTHGVEWWALDAQVPGGEMGDYVWIDANEDGLQDPHESGLAGVLVTLEHCDGTPVETAYSNAGGGYRFDELAAGDYRVRFAVPPGYILTSPQRSADFRIDSDPDPETATMLCMTLAPEQKRLHVDAGFVPRPEG